MKSMAAYKYPYRTEAVGFPRCPVQPFKPTTGKHLYYSSARLLGSKGVWPDKASKELHIKSMKWLVKNRQYFDKITVALQFDLKTAGLDNFTEYGFEFQEVGTPAELSTATAMRQFQDVDVVISFNTFAHLAVANGIPTVIAGKLGEVVNRHYKLKNCDLYKQWFDFPLDLFAMNGEDLLRLRDRMNPEVEEWKRINIGTSFDADKFISVVKEFV